ncbi:hypothetical protein [Aminobacter sp. MDW-2]|uniref:hypothetical protein n=1 Tax=Aminobacter sp. MDW-2 TaxID=2666139 RepID=UPI0012AEF9C1|nr:hypothetical protein [Aminobacter sp. MDW-2]MRX32787.1 hypothetical protein [Aminobacter sp. MDW-2]QNH34551.1 hypothetical protein H5P29_00940 [Aminobacter sp. MDW-2]
MTVEQRAIEDARRRGGIAIATALTMNLGEGLMTVVQMESGEFYWRVTDAGAVHLASQAEDAPYEP